MGYTSRNFMLKRSQATLGYFFFFSIFNLFFPHLNYPLCY
jgi:hypothetical protein